MTSSVTVPAVYLAGTVVVVIGHFTSLDLKVFVVFFTLFTDDFVMLASFSPDIAQIFPGRLWPFSGQKGMFAELHAKNRRHKKKHKTPDMLLPS